jgi:hypothetical protein
LPSRGQRGKCKVNTISSDIDLPHLIASNADLQIKKGEPLLVRPEKSKLHSIDH